MTAKLKEDSLELDFGKLRQFCNFSKVDIS